MAVPERKMGRAHAPPVAAPTTDRGSPPAPLPQCGEVKLPTVCGNCGYYRDREVIETDGTCVRSRKRH